MGQSLRSSAQEAVTSIDLVELFFRLLAGWKVILALVIIGGGLGYAYTTYKLKPQYSATSTIYVLSNKESVINMSDLQLGSALTGDYIKVFSMWEVHEQVISKLNLPYSYSQMESMLSVTNVSNTRMLDIKITCYSAQEAADIANAYAEIGSQYISENMSMDKPSIMSVALVPSSPIGPSKTKNTMIGAILGGMIACGIYLVLYLLDDKIKTAEDVAKYTGLVNLASIPAARSQKGGKKHENHYY